jgi:NAD(P)-dependent dehydrogenase (short-subunit alcohol dehydrogenase family)
MQRLAGSVAIVTGGASGLGEATVRLFHAEGARVVIADVAEELGRALALGSRGRSPGAASPRVSAQSTDVRFSPK